MNTNNYRLIFLFFASLTVAFSVYGQVEGESEVTTIIIRKPGVSGKGKEGSKLMYGRDTLPPEVTIISPRVDTSLRAYVSSADFYLAGRLTDVSGIETLEINDAVIAPDEYGFFQKSFSLQPGLNVFRITATDRLSNSCSRLLTVLLRPADEVKAYSDAMPAEGVNHALIIGINHYDDPALVDLDNPVTDATLLYTTLIGNYMFEPADVIFLKDPTRAEIIREMDKLSNRLAKTDNLLIFYAGHGFWDRQKETGFWLPADAEKSSTVNWIRNSTIQDYVDEIKTRHTLLITDACFAGSIFKSRAGFLDASVAVNKLYSMTSRKAMTSGTMEEVPDRSVFLEFLLKRLLENDKKYLSASELFNSFREAVLNNSPNVPQYGIIQDTGDEGGEYIFIKR